MSEIQDIKTWPSYNVKGVVVGPQVVNDVLQHRSSSSSNDHHGKKVILL